jgi:hypothetical protein
MKLLRLYADAHGESHWEERELALPGRARGGAELSAWLPVRGVQIREVPASYDLDWHPAPRRQYIVNLDGGVEITASDGEVRRLGPGELFLVEDVWGKGHRSRALDGRPRRCLFLALEAPE